MGSKRPRQFDFDVLIIGSGAGGGVAAHIATREKKHVAIVEQEVIGGECPNFGCVPTKALLQAAETYHVAKNGAKFGIKASNVQLDYKAIKAWKDLAVEHTGTVDGEEAFASEGIQTIKGHAHFISPHEISVGKRRFTARKFLIATGTRNFEPPIEGLQEVGYMTYRKAIDLTALPKSLFIIGGGAIGCEFGSLFSTLGSKVTIAEFAPRLIVHEDTEVGELTQALFERDGVSILTDTKVIKVEKSGPHKVVTYQTGHVIQKVTVDEILLAAGKVPNTDLGLENAGVVYDRHGIKTDDTMRTNVKHIYVAGDVTGPFAFTHMASYQSRIAAHNMFSREKVHANYHAVPRCVFFADLEIASVGATEAELKAKKIKYKTNAVPTSIIGRANTSDQSVGFVKVIASHTGVLIGASIIAPRAGEMMQELALAIQNGLKAEDVAATIHAFPTWSEAVRIACAGID